MKITDIETLILRVPDLQEDATSSSQDDFVVIIHTDAGIIGHGETYYAPHAVAALGGFIQHLTHRYQRHMRNLPFTCSRNGPAA